MESQTAVRTCERYRRNGDACTNPTDRIDGWCHQPDCDGFPTPRVAEQREPVFRPPLGTVKHIAMTRHVALDVEVDEVDVVGVTRRAREQFIAKHGGTDSAAEVQIRQMLEDFLLDGARMRQPSGYVKLSKSGYTVLLSPDHGTVTGYDTVHRERSWEQYKAGVPSRFEVQRRSSSEPPPGPAARRGPAVPLAAFVAAVEPAEVHVTWRALASYSKRRRIDSTDVDALSRGVREELATALLTAEVAGRCDEHVVTLHAGEYRWLLSPDAHSVIDCKPL